MGLSLCPSRAMKNDTTQFKPGFKSRAKSRQMVLAVKVRYIPVPNASQRLSRAITMLLSDIIKSNEDKHPDKRGRERKA
jgi:hypothetical protein